MLLVRYAEIGLKGKNRGFFESKLIENIKSKLGKVKIEKDSGSILVNSDSAKGLKEVFGISWFASVTEIGLPSRINSAEPSEITDFARSLKEMQDLVLSILEEKKPKTFRLTINRSDKKFPMKSQDLAREIGKVCEEKGFEAELKNPELEIFVDILQSRAVVYTERQQGLGGLPVGSSGKVLCLLSGGIDSPVAAFLMAKRGCTVDYLHFYALRNTDEVKKSKIPKIGKELERFVGKSKLFLAPFEDFQMAVLKTGEYELQLFRRFMMKFAEEFALKEGYGAVVLGDNLNQVASQTLENISAVEQGLQILIFRPLLTFDKREIENLAKEIGTYDFSIENYKDCCSIIVRKPKTKMKKEKLLELENSLQLNSLIEKTMQKLEKI